MSSLTLSDLSYIGRDELARRLQNDEQRQSLAVIDVRDSGRSGIKSSFPTYSKCSLPLSLSDHVGGHIRNSKWIPSTTLVGLQFQFLSYVHFYDP